MSDLESLFEKIFTEIPIDESGRHLLEAGAVTGCLVKGDAVTITLDLPPDEAVRKKISGIVEERCGALPGIKTVNIQMAKAQKPSGGEQAQSPAGSQPREPMRPVSNLYLDNYENVIAVASGKGGVGKSTVAVNMAISLAKMGHKVSLFDADIYGPSLPIMMGLRNTRPDITDDKLLPLEKHGVHVMSIGNLIDEAAATIWRGPMVHQVIEQLLRDTIWPGGDYMIIDLPPGTGDAQLTLTQLCAVAGAVIVSTPQDVALLDAIKGVMMFQKVDIPIIGMIENMSSFICPHCSEETPIFNKDNAKKASTQNNIPFLGSIPIELAIREGGDNGIPIASIGDGSPSEVAFREISEAMTRELAAIG